MEGKRDGLKYRQSIIIEYDATLRSVPTFCRIDTYTPSLHLEEKYTVTVEIVDELTKLVKEMQKRLNELNKLKRQEKAYEKRSNDDTTKK